MAKNILQDIVPPEKRSIRNIPIPAKNTRSAPPISDIRRPESPAQPAPFEIPKVPRRPVVAPAEDTDFDNHSTPRIYPYDDNQKKPPFSFVSSKKMILGGGVIGVIILFVVIASLFSGATVTVVPNEQTVVAGSETVFSAMKEPVAGELGFEILKITKSLGKEVPATGEESVERKASGTIVIYNSADKTSQRLIKNTRFETPTGLIYRVNESVVVPGVKVENGKEVPGSVEVVVYADEAGEKYNIGKFDFTIPGFKDDPRYKTVYARSKTDMTGGFVGTVKKVSEEDAKKAKDELHAKLAEELMREAKAQTPTDFTLYDTATFFTYNSLPQSGDSKSSATINEEGTITAVIFNNREFAQYVASRIAPDISKSQVAIVGAESLALNVVDKDTISPQSVDALSFTLDGTLKFVSRFDEEKLKSDLAGRSKDDLSGVLQLYPSISTASATTRPFWKGSFPDDVSDIEIIIAPKS